MVIRYQRITIIKSDKPKSHGLNQELQWFGASLGLFGLRDKDKSCFRIFIALIKGLKKGGYQLEVFQVTRIMAWIMFFSPWLNTICVLPKKVRKIC